jgi:hypothetical protein
LDKAKLLLLKLEGMYGALSRGGELYLRARSYWCSATISRRWIGFSEDDVD